MSLVTRKLPTSVENHVGIEIEFLMPGERLDGGSHAEIRSNREVLYSNLEKTGYVDNIQCLHETIRYDSYGIMEYGWECKTVCEENQFKDVIGKVCNALIESGAIIDTERCGIHIHLDMRNRNASSSFEKLVNNLPELYAKCAPERKENKHCLPNIRKFGEYESAKRYAINQASYRKYKTLEVRCMESNLDSTRINSFVEMLIKIVDSETSRS